MRLGENRVENRRCHTETCPSGHAATSSRAQRPSPAALLATPFLSRRAFAEPVELTMLAWYGHAEPDVVAAFEAENNVKFKPKYYTGGDNMLGLIAQSPPGTFDVILSDAEYVQQLNAAGYIEELDPADYRFDEYFPEFQQFPGHWQDGKLYSVLTRLWLPRCRLQHRRDHRAGSFDLQRLLVREADRQGRPLRLAPAEPRPD